MRRDQRQKSTFASRGYFKSSQLRCAIIQRLKSSLKRFKCRKHFLRRRIFCSTCISSEFSFATKPRSYHNAQETKYYFTKHDHHETNPVTLTFFFHIVGN